MNLFKIFTITLFIIFSSITNLSYAETLKFPAATYEGDVKKGKAHGKGIFTFLDGSTYEGQVKKNKIHGKGIYTDAAGKTYEGTFKFGTFKTKIDGKTRSVVKIKPKTGHETFIEMRGTGNTASKWFEAEKNSSGEYVLTAKGETDMKIAAASGGSGGSTGSGSSGC